MNGKGVQMQLTGAPKLVVWAEKVVAQPRLSPLAVKPLVERSFCSH